MYYWKKFNIHKHRLKVIFLYFLVEIESEKKLY